MPTTKVRRKSDGVVIPVEHPEGASQDDIIGLAKQQPRSVLDAPVVSPKTPGLIKPSVSGYLGEGLKRRSGDIGAMIGATVAPGTGVRGLASRVLASEAGHDVGQAATGQTITPGYGAASQLVGEGIAKTVAPLLSPVTYRAFADRTAKQAAAWLKTNVPAWEDFAGSAKGLYAMAHGVGQRHLSQTFETAMRGIKRAIPDTLIVHVPETIETAGRLEQIAKPRNARALIDELPALRKAGGKPYRQALTALADELPEGLAPELDAARREYRFGAGFIDFAERGKFLRGERYDPATAQAALDRFGKSLLGRGMDDLAGIIRGPGRDPIQATRHSPWARRLYGASLGEAAGFPFGISGRVAGPIVGGALGEKLLPATTYRNVPLSPSLGLAARVMRAAPAEGLREGARQLNIPPEKVWPGVGGP